MAKRKRASTKRSAKETTPDSEDQDDEILEWRCSVHRQKQKKVTNEFPEFDDIGKNLGYVVELKGKRDAWEAMPQYRRWNHETGEEYHVGEYIAVCWNQEWLSSRSEQGPSKRQKRLEEEEDIEEPEIEIVDEDSDAVYLDDCALAKVLECRAADPEHVYLRIIWLYRPEETGDGRQPWQAEDEVIPSTHMQIIDATACNGRISVKEWEPGVDCGPVTRRKFYWRQTLDTLGKGKLSSIEGHCLCERPTDLSKGIWAKDMIKCTNDECEAWMHTSCLCNAAQAQVLADMENDDSPFENVEEPGMEEKTLDIPDPFENTTINGIRGHINSFTAGLVSMVTPSSSRIAPAPEAPISQNRRSDRKGKGKKKADDEIAVMAEVEHETCQMQLTEVATKKRVSVPVVCLFCHEGLKPKSTVKE